MNNLKEFLPSVLVDITNEYLMISLEDVILNRYWVDYEFKINVKLFEILQNKMGTNNTLRHLPRILKDNFFLKISRARTMQISEVGREVMLSYCYEQDIDEDEFFEDF
jgi:hypothetical protein